MGVSVTDVVVRDGHVTGVTMGDGSELLTHLVIFAAGPWSGVLIEDIFDVPLPLEGVRSTSLVFHGCETVITDFKVL